MKKTPEIPLSEAMERAAAKNAWPVMAIRDAVERGEIPSTLHGAERHVRWRDIRNYVESLRVY